MTTYKIIPICAGYYGPCAENTWFRDGDANKSEMFPSMMFALQSSEDLIMVDLSFDDPIRCAVDYTNTYAPLDFVRQGSLAEIVRKAGIEPYDVNKIILTHCHFDHCGGGYAFPHATDVYVQRADFQRFSNFDTRQLTTSCENLQGLGHRNLHLLDGDDSTSLPGIEFKLVGGHSDGSQLIIVNTEQGKVIIPGDIVMHPDNIRKHRYIGFGTGDLDAADLALDWIIDSGLRCYYSHFENQDWIG